jgi:hypothetical protein
VGEVRRLLSQLRHPWVILCTAVTWAAVLWIKASYFEVGDGIVLLSLGALGTLMILRFSMIKHRE